MAGHKHGEAPGKLGPRLVVSIAINLVIFGSQLAGGLLAGSLALVSDALHNVTDVVALALSYGAYRISQRPASRRYTFAFLRAEVLAALLNALGLIAISAFIAIEAVQRLMNPQPVASGIVIAFAAFGMLANAFAAWLLRGHGSNLNVKSAVLHLVSDSIASVGVLLAGILMRLYGWYIVDPIVSLVLAAWMTYESVGLLRSAAHILMQGVPESVELDMVKAAMVSEPGVEVVHDLHVWALSAESIVLSAHVVVPHAQPQHETTATLQRIKRMLHDRFGVEHATLEIEDEDACAGGDCGQDE